MKIIINKLSLVISVLLFSVVTPAQADAPTVAPLTESDLTTEQATAFIEEQLDGGWNEEFHLVVQTAANEEDQEQENRLVRETALLLREILSMQKRRPGRLQRADCNCYALKINGSLTVSALNNLLRALRETMKVVGVGNLTLGNDTFSPGVICPADRQLFAEPELFKSYLAEHFQ